MVKVNIEVYHRVQVQGTGKHLGSISESPTVICLCVSMEVMGPPIQNHKNTEN